MSLFEVEGARLTRAVNLLGIANLLRGVAVGLFVGGLLAILNLGWAGVTLVLDLFAVGFLLVAREYARAGLRLLD